MKLKCPDFSSSLPLKSPALVKVPGCDSGSVIRKGSFYRRSDSRRIQRYFCKSCGRHFSRASFSPSFRQKKRRVNSPLLRMLCSGVSQRRAAFLLRVNQKTIARKFRFLAQEARKEHQRWRERIPRSSLRHVQFDDLETSEHTKCKPLSVALAVVPKTRKILSFQVSQMPAKGHLAEISRQKYGVREDERSLGWARLFLDLKPHCHENVCFVSDENPHYPRHVAAHHPSALHRTVKGQRGALTGQGELKKIGFDPLFSLNHTCAMLRANLNRLFRRTWCTTKKREGLIDHLSLYVVFHNRSLTA